MAALPEQPAPSLVDLRQVRVDDIEPLLAEETAIWEQRLDWDFRPSADLVRRFIRMQSLGGFALVSGRRVMGYVYYVCEERKGLVGDVFLTAAMDTPDLEAALLDAAIRALGSLGFVERIESQMMLASPEIRRRLPMAERTRCFRRNLMALDLRPAPALAPKESAGRFQYEPWHEREHEQAARLISKTYRGHVDAEINDQYRTTAGARRFLTNIVQYPGCGSFFQPGSLVAVDPADGRLAGICLASLVAFDVGHVTQVCVDPEWQGRGVGWELMRRSIEAMAGHGCRKATLTVTSSNRAEQLYQRMGFRTAHSFDAVVWELR